ncbi:AAA ATPase central domain protein [Desulfatibacillum aliphaticivorans]|uniref:Replication-associated recombination protein A n=1 Tax=Desulfatibacillum aliphaticivorans TaxID=218208 RepID=B8FM49_DESAL|nr:replication-associated recombination protein A [Desulfatibacillum aliphaticivorans]ACL05782.1 AAA ATPase central domain protein [Desulfatibacillum aliphaticivorans]
MSLFDRKNAEPLAEKMRPRTLDEFIGQEAVVGEGGIVRRAVESDHLFSMIFWGPPGCGKTTLARIMANASQSYFMQISAVGSGVKQIREVVEEAKDRRNFHAQKSILFVDEIHRFNKAQQDGFLPHVESGIITLIGATTENPSFEVISPLLSRCRVVVLKPLSSDDMKTVIQNAVQDEEKGLGMYDVSLEEEALENLAQGADGDARKALNTLELAVFLARPDEEGRRVVTAEHVAQAWQKKQLNYDKGGDQHFDIISALHKSLRGSDPDAAVYWLMRMLSAGEDPLYVARRMVRFASEDVGNADPHALVICMAAVQSYQFLGSPEGELALVQACLYLATAPKSNAAYMALKAAKKKISQTGAKPVPMHIRNAPTGLMKELGYGAEYKYPHDYEGAYVPEEYMPEGLEGTSFYRPTPRGYESVIKKRMDHWSGIKKNKKNSD